MAEVGYLALGSNVEDRLEHLRQGASRIAACDGIEVAARSMIYETESVEGGGPGDFLNAVLRVVTSLSAHELLDVVQSVEREMGRPQPPRHGPRCIDIDILMLDNLTLRTHRLQLPHPGLTRRKFVLQPLCDVLVGGWVRPWPEGWI